MRTAILNFQFKTEDRLKQKNYLVCPGMRNNRRLK